MAKNFKNILLPYFFAIPVLIIFKFHLTESHTVIWSRNKLERSIDVGAGEYTSGEEEPAPNPPAIIPKDLDEQNIRNFVSDHEVPRDVPTNVIVRGNLGTPAPDSGINLRFTPRQVYYQVRRYDTEVHLPKSAAKAEASTAEEVINAPRLREVISHKKTQEVYEEQGYEDAAYDHAGQKKKGELRELKDMVSEKGDKLRLLDTMDQSTEQTQILIGFPDSSSSEHQDTVVTSGSSQKPNITIPETKSATTTTEEVPQKSRRSRLRNSSRYKPLEEKKLKEDEKVQKSPPRISRRSKVRTAENNSTIGLLENNSTKSNPGIEFKKFSGAESKISKQEIVKENFLINAKIKPTTYRPAALSKKILAATKLLNNFQKPPPPNFQQFRNIAGFKSNHGTPTSGIYSFKNPSISDSNPNRESLENQNSDFFYRRPTAPPPIIIGQSFKAGSNKIPNFPLYNSYISPQKDQRIAPTKGRVTFKDLSGLEENFSRSKKPKFPYEIEDYRSNSAEEENDYFPIYKKKIRFKNQHEPRSRIKEFPYQIEETSEDSSEDKSEFTKKFQEFSKLKNKPPEPSYVIYPSRVTNFKKSNFDTTGSNPNFSFGNTDPETDFTKSNFGNTGSEKLRKPSFTFSNTDSENSGAKPSFAKKSPYSYVDPFYHDVIRDEKSDFDSFDESPWVPIMPSASKKSIHNRPKYEHPKFEEFEKFSDDDEDIMMISKNRKPHKNKVHKPQSYATSYSIEHTYVSTPHLNNYEKFETQISAEPGKKPKKIVNHQKISSNPKKNIAENFELGADDSKEYFDSKERNYNKFGSNKKTRLKKPDDFDTSFYQFDFPDGDGEESKPKEKTLLPIISEIEVFPSVEIQPKYFGSSSLEIIPPRPDFDKKSIIKNNIDLFKKIRINKNYPTSTPLSYTTTKTYLIPPQEITTEMTLKYITPTYSTNQKEAGKVSPSSLANQNEENINSPVSSANQKGDSEFLSSDQHAIVHVVNSTNLPSKNISTTPIPDDLIKLRLKSNWGPDHDYLLLNSRHPHLPKETTATAALSGDSPRTKITKLRPISNTEIKSNESPRIEKILIYPNDYNSSAKFVEKLTLAQFSHDPPLPNHVPLQDRLTNLANLLNTNNIGQESDLAPNRTTKRFARELSSGENFEFVNLYSDGTTTEIPVDVQKYPFYKTAESDGISKYSVLRYVSNPKYIPPKRKGGMQFYESRNNIQCRTPSGPKNFIPPRNEENWNYNNYPKGKRIAGLGDDILCHKIKFFGSDPLDNPFFKEQSISYPEVFKIKKVFSTTTEVAEQQVPPDNWFDGQLDAKINKRQIFSSEVEESIPKTSELNFENLFTVIGINTIPNNFSNLFNYVNDSRNNDDKYKHNRIHEINRYSDSNAQNNFDNDDTNENNRIQEIRYSDSNTQNNLNNDDTNKNNRYSDSNTQNNLYNDDTNKNIQNNDDNDSIFNSNYYYANINQNNQNSDSNNFNNDERNNNESEGNHYYNYDDTIIDNKNYNIDDELLDNNDSTHQHRNDINMTDINNEINTFENKDDISISITENYSFNDNNDDYINSDISNHANTISNKTFNNLKNNDESIENNDGIHINNDADNTDAINNDANDNTTYDVDTKNIDTENTDAGDNKDHIYTTNDDNENNYDEKITNDSNLNFENSNIDALSINNDPITENSDEYVISEKNTNISNSDHHYFSTNNNDNQNISENNRKNNTINFHGKSYAINDANNRNQYYFYNNNNDDGNKLKNNNHHYSSNYDLYLFEYPTEQNKTATNIHGNDNKNKTVIITNNESKQKLLQKKNLKQEGIEDNKRPKRVVHKSNLELGLKNPENFEEYRNRGIKNNNQNNRKVYPKNYVDATLSLKSLQNSWKNKFNKIVPDENVQSRILNNIKTFSAKSKKKNRFSDLEPIPEKITDSDSLLYIISPNTGLGKWMRILNVEKMSNENQKNLKFYDLKKFEDSQVNENVKNYQFSKPKPNFNVHYFMANQPPESHMYMEIGQPRKTQNFNSHGYYSNGLPDRQNTNENFDYYSAPVEEIFRNTNPTTNQIKNNRKHSENFGNLKNSETEPCDLENSIEQFPGQDDEVYQASALLNKVNPSRKESIKTSNNFFPTRNSDFRQIEKKSHSSDHFGNFRPHRIPEPNDRLYYYVVDDAHNK